MSRTDIVKVHKAEIIEIDPNKKYILTLSVDGKEYTMEHAAEIARRVKEAYAEFENVQVLMYREGIKIHIEQHG